jgi:hypothetical protein
VGGSTRGRRWEGVREGGGGREYEREEVGGSRLGRHSAIDGNHAYTRVLARCSERYIGAPISKRHSDRSFDTLMCVPNLPPHPTPNRSTAALRCFQR